MPPPRPSRSRGPGCHPLQAPRRRAALAAGSTLPSPGVSPQEPTYTRGSRRPALRSPKGAQGAPGSPAAAPAPRGHHVLAPGVSLPLRGDELLTSFLPRSRALRTQLCVLVTSLSDPHETSTGPPLESPLWPETHCWPSSLHRRRALPRGRFTLEDNSLTSGSAASRGSRNLGTCNMGSRWGSLSAWF